MQPARAPRIIVKPWDESDWPLAWRWIGEYYFRVADDEAPKTQSEFVSKQMGRPATSFGVYRDGSLGGLVSFDILSPTLCEGHCLFKKGRSAADSFWGRSTTVPAIVQALQWMWVLGIERIICPVFESNRLMAKLLEQLGAVRDAEPPAGAKSRTVRQGRPVNVLYYSLYPDS